MSVGGWAVRAVSQTADHIFQRSCSSSVQIARVCVEGPTDRPTDGRLPVAAAVAAVASDRSTMYDGVRASDHGNNSTVGHCSKPLTSDVTRSGGRVVWITIERARARGALLFVRRLDTLAQPGHVTVIHIHRKQRRLFCLTSL